MSTNTLFTSTPTVTPALTAINTTANLAPLASTTNTTEISTNSIVLPTLPNKKNLANIPPAFFVGAQVKENTTNFEPQSSGSELGSITGYGDRRLSRVLAADTPEKTAAGSEQTIKRIALEPSAATRGLFGDKRLKVATNNYTAPVTTNTSNSTEAHSSSKTIKVFGYLNNAVHDVVQHFGKYGKITDFKASPGNWMTITYESNASAVAALSSNGIVMPKNNMIGVSLEKETAVAISTIKKMEIAQPVFKYQTVELGSGKVGISASDNHESNGASSSIGGFLSKLKDALLGW